MSLEIRRVTSLPPKENYVYCDWCREFFVNDTLCGAVKCPLHPEKVMQNFSVLPDAKTLYLMTHRL